MRRILADGSSERVNTPVLLLMMMDHIDDHSADTNLSAARAAPLMIEVAVRKP
jgi:hypothetical protein